MTEQIKKTAKHAPFKFTDTSVGEKLKKIKPNEDATLYDNQLKGLALRKQSGSWSVILQKRINGQLRKPTICHLTEATRIGWDAVRSKAMEIQLQLESGQLIPKRMNAAKKVEVEILTGKDLSLTTWDQALKLKIAKGENRATSYEEDIRAIKAAGIGLLPVSAMTIEQAQLVQERLSKLKKLDGRGKPSKITISNNTVQKHLRHIKSIWQVWADKQKESKQVVPSNPFEGKGNENLTVKKTYIKNEYFGTFLKHLLEDSMQAEGSDGIRARACLLMVTMGFRKDEVLEMPPSELVMPKGRWVGKTLPTIHLAAERSKSGRSLTRSVLPLIAPALELQVSMASEKYIFASNAYEGTNVSEVIDYLEKLCEQLDIPRYTAHDLRRTFEVQITLAGISADVAMHMANHSEGTGSSKVNWGYKVGAIDELEKSATQQFNDYLIIKMAQAEE
jgi:integrase